MKSSKRQLKALAALNLDLFTAESISRPAPATIHARIQEAAGPRAAAVSQLPAHVPAQDALPSVAELYNMFDQYNWMYFNGKLPKPVIEYSTRMTSAGAYTPHNRKIRIGRRYHEIFPEDLPDTLKHEMIHLIHFNHNAAFKAEARRIGATLTARPHPSLRRPTRYLYVCDNCGTEYPRQKRLVMASCGECSARGKFDARFKLRLKESCNQKFLAGKSSGKGRGSSRK